MSDESPVFIPCEICDTPVAIDDYVTHAAECNSRRFISYHGVSLGDLLQPVAPNQPAARHPSRQLFPELDFASNLASGDEEEEEEEEEAEEEAEAEDDVEPAAGIIPARMLIQALLGGNIMNIANEEPIQPDEEPPTFADLIARFHALAARDLQLPVMEDVVIGLTTDQQAYCLTTKILPTSEGSSPELGTCNICCEDELEEMTQLICGHELCTSCATKHFTANVKCPFCNQDLRDMMSGST
jgi:hypothetical protein